MFLVHARVVMQVSFYADSERQAKELVEEYDELSFVDQVCDDVEIVSCEEKTP
jgi:hypothetical protein